jgi:DNA helicase INO80
MSLSSIMSSGADVEPAPKAQQLPPIDPEPRRLSKASANPPLFVKQEPMATPAPADIPLPSVAALNRGDYESMPPVVSAYPPQQLVPREIPVPDEVEVEAALARIETSEMNDLEGDGLEAEREEYLLQGHKRTLEVQNAEAGKRKVGSLVKLFLCKPSNIDSDDASPPSTASPKPSLPTATQPNRLTTMNTRPKLGSRSKTRR